MDIKLYIFDMDGTLSTTPFVDHQPRTLLPGRKEKIAQLQASGAHCAIASNQDGVAFGFATEISARDEVAGIAQLLSITEFEVAFGHPKPKYGYEEYKSDWHLKRRKPEAGMLFALMDKYNISPESTMMVGDREEDQQAAAKACCNFMWAKDFFAEPGELVAQIYQLYQQSIELTGDSELALFLSKDCGHIGWNQNPASWFAGWLQLVEAPGAIQAAIEKHKNDVAVAAAALTSDFDPFLDSDDLP